jgi:hypothetical protein
MRPFTETIAANRKTVPDAVGITLCTNHLSCLILQYCKLRAHLFTSNVCRVAQMHERGLALVVRTLHWSLCPEGPPDNTVRLLIVTTVAICYLTFIVSFSSSSSSPFPSPQSISFRSLLHPPCPEQSRSVALPKSHKPHLDFLRAFVLVKTAIRTRTGT